MRWGKTSYSREQWAEILLFFALQTHRHCLATVEWWLDKFVWSAPWKLANEDSEQKYPPADWLKNIPDWIQMERHICGWVGGLSNKALWPLRAACSNVARLLIILCTEYSFKWNLLIFVSASPVPSLCLLLQFHVCSHPADAQPLSVNSPWGPPSSCCESVLLLPVRLPADEAAPLSLSEEITASWYCGHQMRFN